MKLVLQVQLLPDAVQTAALRATVERFNEAANWTAGELYREGVTNKRVAQKLVYRELRDRFGLTAQTAILVIHRTCEAYKRDKMIRPEFREHAAITYDARVMRFIGLDKVNLWTLAGRIVVPIVMGKYQAERMDMAKGQCDLMLRKDGKWFLSVTVDIPDGTPIDPRGVIGVDMGVKNLIVTDDGETFQGDGVEAVRRKYQRIRKTCQRTGTKSAKRKLHKVRRKESRYRKDVNHVISKRIVAKAKGTGYAIAVEDLTGIGDRTTARRVDRNRLKGWAFYQLRSFITYKALTEGIPILPVDPRNTSRTCSECGHCDKKNRKSRDEFVCRHCGFELPADWNAARNIRDRGEVMLPIVGVVDTGGRIPVEATDKPVLASPRALAVGS